MEKLTFARMATELVLRTLGGNSAAASALAMLSAARAQEEEADSSSTSKACAAAPLQTLQQVIFNPIVNGEAISVVGTCVLLDHALGRIDLSEPGAKLIVNISMLDAPSAQLVASAQIGVHSKLRITGVIKKQSRRTFMEARTIVAEE